MSTLQKMLEHRRGQKTAEPVKEVKVELNLADIKDDETAKKPAAKKAKK